MTTNDSNNINNRGSGNENVIYSLLFNMLLPYIEQVANICLFIGQQLIPIELLPVSLLFFLFLCGLVLLSNY